MENYFESQKDAIFRNVEVLIYVFDIESPQHKRDMEQFLSCVEMVAKYSTSEQTKVYCLIHKMDLIHKEEDRARIYTERDREIKAKVAPFFPTPASASTVTTFATSIWDETLYKAWSAIVHSLIPNVHTLERQLVAFCNLLAADEVVLFEKATFLVICSAVVKHNSDAHRYEKISNIIKQFKLSCSKSSNGEFLSMQVQNKHFIAFIDQFTTNTYIMIVGPGEGANSGGGGKMLPAAVQLNLKVARPHFERFVQQNVSRERHSLIHTMILILCASALLVVNSLGLYASVCFCVLCRCTNAVELQSRTPCVLQRFALRWGPRRNVKTALPTNMQSSRAAEIEQPSTYRCTRPACLRARLRTSNLANCAPFKPSICTAFIATYNATITCHKPITKVLLTHKNCHTTLHNSRMVIFGSLNFSTANPNCLSYTNSTPTPPSPLPPLPPLAPSAK